METLFAGIALFCIAMAACVVLAKNPVYSAFSLILSFFGLSGLYLLWGATFISVIQILIYAGAIVVLFVFVVMLLNLGKSITSSKGYILSGVSGLVVWFLSFLLLRVLSLGQISTVPSNVEMGIRSISKLLFTQYLWPFEVLSIFLLVLIVAVFSIAHPDSEGGET